MMMKSFKQAMLATMLVISFTACKKDDTTQNAPQTTEPGAYILSEGSFGANNTKLSFFSTINNLVVGDYFLQQNPSIAAGLGDTGNDIIIYGGKLYIVLNNSNNVAVLNAADAKFIKNISFINGNIKKQPRYAASARGKVYVTSYDNTVSVIDTTSLIITKTIAVGANPEGIAANNNFLYVANSGGLNVSPDSTVSVIDLNTETELRKIKVGLNPFKVEINTLGDVYISANGNYSNIPPSISSISGAAGVTTSTNLGAGFEYNSVRIQGDIAFFYNNFGGVGTSKMYNTNTKTVVRNEFITDNTKITTPYALNINPLNGDVYIGDATDFKSSGIVTCFGSNGVKKFSFTVAPGINPNKIIFRK